MSKATQKQIDDARRAMAAEADKDAAAIATQAQIEEADNAAAYVAYSADYAQGIRNRPFSDYVAEARAAREERTKPKA